MADSEENKSDHVATVFFPGLGEKRKSFLRKVSRIQSSTGTDKPSWLVSRSRAIRTASWTAGLKVTREISEDSCHGTYARLGARVGRPSRHAHHGVNGTIENDRCPLIEVPAAACMVKNTAVKFVRMILEALPWVPVKT